MLPKTRTGVTSKKSLDSEEGQRLWLMMLLERCGCNTKYWRHMRPDKVDRELSYSSRAFRWSQRAMTMFSMLAVLTHSLFCDVQLYSKEKWDASGGNEAISRLSASFPQGTKDTLGSAAKNLFNKDHLRSLTVFFGIGEERAFYLEKSPSLLTARLRHNFVFFYLNYMVVFGILFVLTMITSITTMIGLVILGGAWLYVIRASSEGHLQIASKYPG